MLWPLTIKAKDVTIGWYFLPFGSFLCGMHVLRSFKGLSPNANNNLLMVSALNKIYLIKM